jgi:trans-aconitate methyltransferase
MAPAILADHLPVSDQALYLNLYERALIDLWPHLSFAEDKPLKTICDLGAGQGVTSNALRATFPQARLVSLGAEHDEWPRMLTDGDAFDLIICHNGWPLGWLVEDGLERLIEVTARGGTLIIHLDLSLYEAFEPRFGYLDNLAMVHQRLGHLAPSKDQIEIWRTDYAPMVTSPAQLEGLIDGFKAHQAVSGNPVPVLARLKNQMTPEGRLISRHLFIKLSL